jgi:hypothetical protein
MYFSRHTSEDLGLLIAYLSLIGIWFAIPSVNLLLAKDKRYPIALAILGAICTLLVVAYYYKWEGLFPPPAALASKEDYYLADYDKVKWCKCRPGDEIVSV